MKVRIEERGHGAIEGPKPYQADWDVTSIPDQVISEEYNRRWPCLIKNLHLEIERVGRENNMLRDRLGIGFMERPKGY